MANNRYYVTFSFGATILSMLCITAFFYWNSAFGDLRVLRLLYNAILSFSIGLAIAILLYYLRYGSDFNLTGISLVAFLFSIYIFTGDVRISTINMGYIFYSICISLGFAFLIGIIVYIFFNK